jgi:hypothetical protein
MSALNNLTALMPTFFAGLNKVQQEQTDLIDAVNQNVKLEQAVIGQDITFPIASPAALSDTQYSGVPDPNGETPGTGSLKLEFSKSGLFKYNGEEIQQLQLGGVYSNYYADQLAQRVRALRKAVSDSIMAKAVLGACRATGAPGTPPFQTVNELTDFAAANKVLNDNGSPGMDRHMILDTMAVSKIQGKQATLFRANEAGTDRLLRTGTIGSVEGFAVGMDTQIKPYSTFGTSVGNKNTGAVAAGDKTFVLDSSGTGTPVAGDFFYFTGDTEHKYVVKSFAAGTRVVTVNDPGILEAHASVVLVFNTTAGAPNPFFTRDALTLIARQPLLPYAGPSGQLLDLTTLPDPRCGLIYQVAMWQAGRTIVIEVALVWGAGVTNAHDLGILWG